MAYGVGSVRQGYRNGPPHAVHSWMVTMSKDVPHLERSQAHARRRRTRRQASDLLYPRTGRLRPGHRPVPDDLLVARRTPPLRRRPATTDPPGRGGHLPRPPGDGTRLASSVPGPLRRWRRRADPDRRRRWPRRPASGLAPIGSATASSLSVDLRRGRDRADRLRP